MKFFTDILIKIFKGVISMLPIVFVFIIVQYLFSALLFLTSSLFGFTNSISDTALLIFLTFFTLYFIGLSYDKNKKFLIIQFSESIIKHIPGIKNIYIILEDILAMFFKASEDKYLGVIEIEYGGYPQYGFITKDFNDEDRYMVFIPTAPNPTNGFVILLDKNNPKYPYKRIDLEPSAALTRVVSLGIK